jgi:hypothetical protein
VAKLRQFSPLWTPADYPWMAGADAGSLCNVPQVAFLEVRARASGPLPTPRATYRTPCATCCAPSTHTCHTPHDTCRGTHAPCQRSVDSHICSLMDIVPIRRHTQWQGWSTHTGCKSALFPSRFAQFLLPGLLFGSDPLLVCSVARCLARKRCNTYT